MKNGSLQIILLLCVIGILLIIGYVIYNMESVKGEESLSINYEDYDYLHSTLEYNGHEIDVIIDTGAQKSVLRKSILDIVSHKIDKRITVKLTEFFGNVTKAQMAKVKRIRFGDNELKNFSFVFSDSLGIFSELDYLQGIVGINILEYFDLHFYTTKYVFKMVKPNRKKKFLRQKNSIYGRKKVV